MKRFLFLILGIFISWLTEAQIQLGQDIEGVGSGDAFGWSVDLSNDGQRMIVGSPYSNGTIPFVNTKGGARLFELLNGTWVQVGSDINGTTNNETLGFSVSISGNGSSFAIADPNGSNGIVTVYKDSSGIIVQKGSSIIGDSLGWSVEMADDGNTIVISSPDKNNTGLVRVYRWLNSDWTQIGYDITGLNGERTGIGLGLSFDGQILAVGTAVNGDTGYVKTYNLQNDTIEPMGSTIRGDNQNSAYFGYSISLGDAGNRLAIGNFTAGYVSVYEWTNTDWTKLGSDIVPTYYSVDFGFSLALSAFGNSLAIGSRRTAGNGLESGRTEIYDWSFNNNNWVLRSVINGEGSGDQSGYWVSISDTGNIVAIGAPYHQPGGQVRVFDVGMLHTEEEYESIFTVFPNPSTGKLRLNINSVAQFCLYGFDGRLIKEGITQGEIDITEVPPGIYRLLIINDLRPRYFVVQKQ